MSTEPIQTGRPRRLPRLPPQHTVRVEKHIWDEARARAERQGKRDRVSQVIREFLDWYTEQPGARMPRRPGPDE